MVALSNLDADCGDTERELDRTGALHAQVTRTIARLRREGEPADSPYLRKLGWQFDACRDWIARLSRDSGRAE